MNVYTYQYRNGRGYLITESSTRCVVGVKKSRREADEAIRDLHNRQRGKGKVSAEMVKSIVAENSMKPSQKKLLKIKTASYAFKYVVFKRRMDFLHMRGKEIGITGARLRYRMRDFL